MKEKIVIFVINNTGSFPSYFAMDLVNLFATTLKEYPNTELRLTERCNIEAMRNHACRYAMGLKKEHLLHEPARADYLVMIDDDHIYQPDFIINLMKHKKEVVTGCTSRRGYPYGQTQFKEYKENINQDSNVVNPKQDDPLMKIGASGPVGMLIKVDILFKLKYPYYERKHIGTDKNIEAIISSDMNFSKKLKEIGVDIWLDPSISFPHEVRRVFVNRGKIVL